MIIRVWCPFFQNSTIINVPHVTSPPVFAFDQDTGINDNVTYSINGQLSDVLSLLFTFIVLGFERGWGMLSQLGTWYQMFANDTHLLVSDLVSELQQHFYHYREYRELSEDENSKE